MVLRDVPLHEPVIEGEPVSTLDIDRLVLRLDVARSLRSGGPVLGELVIDGTHIAVSRGENDLWRLQGWGQLGDEQPAQEGPLGPTVPVVIDSLRVLRTELVLTTDVRSGLEDLRAGIDAELEGLEWRSGKPPNWPASGRATLRIDHMAWRGQELGAGDAVWRMRGRGANLERLHLESALGVVTASGSVAFAGTPIEARIAGGAGRVAFNALDVGALQRPAQPLTSLNGQLEATLVTPPGPGAAASNLDVITTLQPSTLLGQAVSGGELRGRYQLGEGSWRADEAWIELAMGRIAASARGDLSGASYFAFDAAAIDLAKIPEAWRRPEGLGGTASLRGEWTDPLGDPKGTLVASSDDIVLGDMGPGQLEIGAELLGGRQYRLDTFSLSLAPEARRFAGTFAQIDGPVLLSFDERGLAVQDLALTWSGGSLRANGGFDGDLETGRFRPTRIDVQSLDLGILAALLRWPGQPGGELSGELSVSGASRAPDLRADVVWQRPRYAGLSADRIGIDLDASQQRVALQSQIDRAGREQLRLVADASRAALLSDPRAALADARSHFELRATELDLGWLTPLLADRGIRLDGSLDGTLSGVGGSPYPNANGGLRLRDVTISPIENATEPAVTTPIGPLNGQLVFDGPSLEAPSIHVGRGQSELAVGMSVRWSGPRAERIALDAEFEGIGFTGRGQIALRIDEDRLEPSVISISDFEAKELAERAGALRAYGGQLWAELELSGPLDAPDLDLKATWEQPSVGRVQSDRLQWTASARADSVDLRGELYDRGKQTFTVSATAALDRSLALREQVQEIALWSTSTQTRVHVRTVDFSLDWLPLLVPDLPVKTQGAISGEIKGRGDPTIPQLEGEITLANGAFSLATQTASIGPLSGVVHFAGNEAHFEDFVLGARRGQARLSGQINWTTKGLGEIEVRTVFDNYLFNQLGLLRTHLDGSLYARGPVDALDVRGILQLRDVRVSFPSREDPILKEIRVLGLPDKDGVTSILEGEAEIAGIDDKSNLDVAIVLPKGTWVRGIGLNAEIVGQIQVSKPPFGALQYLGRLEVEHGRYTLQGKRFDLDRGVAMFTGSERPVPELDILATRQASRDVLVTAHLTGPADGPKLELTSEPPMDTAEIISYVFFGRSTSGSAGAQLQNTAASVAGVMLLDSVAPELREALRIDEISVTSGDDGEPPAVEVETQVTPDVYLRLVQSLGASADEAVEVRWRFWWEFNLRSSVARSGISSIDVLWAYDFWGFEAWGTKGLRPPPPPYRPDAPPSAKPACGADVDCIP
jgi:autotransporter translocation and assembly factor TamB